MPELPEVETSLKGIEPYLLNQTLKKVVVRNPNLRWPVSQQVHTLVDANVKNMRRRGKYIILEFDAGAILVHLGMSGSLRVLSHDSPVEKHDHIDFITQDKRICLNDPRRFGCVLWSEDWSKHKLISHLGPEPLSNAFDADYLHRKAKGRNVAVKQYIMDSGIVVGVGNIYANEALFKAGIHPMRAAGNIALKRYEVLVEKIKAVLAAAIKQGGTTLRDYVGGDGKPGYFKQQLLVYGCQGKPCVSCGASLKEIRQGGRSTVYCVVCQT